MIQLIKSCLNMSPVKISRFESNYREKMISEQKIIYDTYTTNKLNGAELKKCLWKATHAFNHLNIKAII